MPVVVKNSRGKHVKVLIRNVRLVPSLNDTLFSVDQFWEDSLVDTVFRDIRCVILPETMGQPSLVSWGSKKQTSVALSSCEAEIMAASEAAKEAIFLSKFLNELGHGSTEPLEMGMDNQAAIAISYNPELHSRTKHIDRRHFFVRECVENMQLRVPYVNTVDNLADFFTKPLQKNTFFRMRDILMNVPTVDRIAVARVRIDKTQVRGGCE